MATSLPSVPLPRNTWVDLYAATGITVGSQIIIQNIGSSEAYLSESVASPAPTVGRNIISPRLYLTSADTPVGAWALSEDGTTLQVEAV